MKIYDLLDVLDIFFWTFYLNHLSPLWRPNGDNMETTWGQHEDNVETTWGQHGDHWDVETTWGQHEDNVDNSILFEDL